MDRPLWTDGPARRLRPAEPPLRGAVRPRLHDARQARGDAAQPRIAQRKRLREAARADQHRRLHELAHDRRSDSASGLRDAGRRRGRPDDDESQARQAKGPGQGHYPHRLRRADQLQGRRKPGRRHQERSRNLRQESARCGGAHNQGHRLVPPLRRLHHCHFAAVRGVRLLQGGRRRAVHPRPRFLLQRRSAAQHRRRPDFRGPGGVLLAQPGRGGAAITGRSWQTAGQGYQERAGDRHRLDQLRTQLGLERGASAGSGISEATMAKALNDTVGVKRAIKHFDFSEPYWEGTKQKKLVIQYCKATGKYQHFPRPVSIFTGRRRDVEWREVSGKGVVFSYTVTHRGTPAFRGAEPYAVVSVTLDVGVNFIANIVNCTTAELKIGMKVKPYWHPLDDGTHLMMFQLDNGSA